MQPTDTDQTHASIIFSSLIILLAGVNYHSHLVCCLYKTCGWTSQNCATVSSKLHSGVMKKS